jgi:hypothetical protein
MGRRKWHKDKKPVAHKPRRAGRVEEKHDAQDILRHPFTFPPEVYVVGTGPNGADYFYKAQTAQYVIVCNKAITLEDIPRNIWLCDDGTLPDKEWFRVYAYYYVNNPGRIQDPTPTPVFSEGKLLDLYPRVPFYAKHFTGSMKQPHGPRDGVLRGGASICGKALQLAYWKGARRIVLVGVDMMHRAYHDDPKGQGCMAQMKEDGEWYQCVRFNLHVNFLKKQGVEVVSLSKTALNVPVVSG